MLVVHPAPVQPHLPAGHRLDLEGGGAQPGEDEVVPLTRGDARVHPVPGRPGQIDVVVSEIKIFLAVNSIKDLLEVLGSLEYSTVFLPPPPTSTK